MIMAIVQGIATATFAGTISGNMASEVTHKHIGDSCRVKIYRQYPGGQGGGSGACIRLGIITYCEN